MISLILLLNNVNCKRDGEIVNNVEPRTIKREIYIILYEHSFTWRNFYLAGEGLKRVDGNNSSRFRDIYIYIYRERKRKKDKAFKKTITKKFEGCIYKESLRS